MGRNNYFKFKQFTIIQNQSAMKVGVDSVMLGAWADLQTTGNLLDVGCGTGLLAIMAAQRSNARITAIEIDEATATEAKENVQQSPWPGRIEVIHTSFQEFAGSQTSYFDGIISNPPYFVNSSLPGDSRRKNARHSQSLPYSDLLDGCRKLLARDGQLWLILPTGEADGFCKLAEERGLYLIKSTRVRHKPEKPYHRILMEFSKIRQVSEVTELTIEIDGRFTDEYKKLTESFYLDFTS